jgi:hypothetical protein
MAKQTMTVPAGRSIEKPDGVTREFLIEYDDAEPGVVKIDGVMVSVELLVGMIVDPVTDMPLRFERNGDFVTVHYFSPGLAEPGDAIYYEAPKAKE